MSNNGKHLFLSICLCLFLASCQLGVSNQVELSEIPADESYLGQIEALESGVIWLIENNQNEDGGYGTDFETGQPASSPAATLDPIITVASAGYNPADPYSDRKNTPVGYLQENVVELVAYAELSGGNAGKTVLALVAANQDPNDFAGEDWSSNLTKQYSQTGQYNTSDAYNQSLAILAMVAVNEPVPNAAVEWLKTQQAEDGSWDDGFGTIQNADATAMAIMAMAAAGVSPDDSALEKALDFLKMSQLSTGGWEYGSGFGENANSTALVIQALASMGEDFHNDEGAWSKDGRAPMTALLEWQNDSGAFQADFGQGPADNFFATVQAIPALTGKPFPSVIQE